MTSVVRPRVALAALVSFASLGACSRANSPAPPGSREQNDLSACTWEWTTPETLFVHGASFGFGGNGKPRLLPLGARTALLGDRMSMYADTETSSARFLGVSFGADGNATLIAKPQFMGNVASADMWIVPGPSRSVHAVWTTLGMTTHVLHATTDGTRWSEPDTGFSIPLVALSESHVVAAAGDDVVVALPTAEEHFSGVVVGIRAHGQWDVARFAVPHASNWQLPLAAATDGSGTTITYFHMLPSMGGVATDSVAPGLYARHRPWGGEWGPETRVSDRPGFAPIPVRTADGAFHVFWRGLLADSSLLFHSATRDFKSWRLDQATLPHDVQSVDVVAEDANVRIVMVQTDDPNGMDMKYSNLLSGTWGPTGFSAFETVPIAKPGGWSAISASRRIQRPSSGRLSGSRFNPPVIREEAPRDGSRTCPRRCSRDTFAAARPAPTSWRVFHKALILVGPLRGAGR